MGIPYLSKSLNTILLGHIKKSIPRISQQIQSTLTDKESELRLSSVTSVDGDPLLEVDNGPLVLALINKFINAYGDMIEGRFFSAVQMQGGSRINYIFHDVFKKAINQIDPFEYLTE